MAKLAKDLTDAVFGELRALKRAGRQPNGHTLWFCKCTCGAFCKAVTSRLLNGSKTSCGCKSRNLGKYIHPPAQLKITKNVRKVGGCWLWCLSKQTDGYGSVKYHGRTWRAHRLSWEAFRGPIPDHLCVLHKCDVRLCVNPDHLFLGNREDNAKDMVLKDRQTRGSKSPNTSLEEWEILFIRDPRRTIKETAYMFGVSCSVVKSVRSGRTWRHVK